MVAIRLFVLILIFCCLFASPLRADVQRVNSPFYGEVLFNFNQQKFFTAIVQLDKGLSQGQLSGDVTEAEILLGSLYLSYGLHRNAQQIFDRLLESSVDTESRDLAWFYLAKIQFQRGYYQLAANHLEKITSPLSDLLEDDRLSLMALSLMQLNRTEDAIEHLSQQTKNHKNIVYTRFNLATSLLKQGEQKAAMKLLNEIATTAKQDAETAALVDRVNVLLANQYLENEQFELAKQYFNQVELHGRFSSQALLGLGWSAFGKNEFATANAAWTELAGRDRSDRSVLEAHLTRPYLLYRMKNYSDALAEYKKAIAVYQQQLDLIEQQLSQADFPQLIMETVGLESDDEIGWYWQHDALEGPLLSSYMLAFVSSHEFQESLKNYRDLLFIKKNLSKQQINSLVLDDIIDVKTAANDELKPRAENRLRQLSEQDHVKVIQALADKIVVIERDEDALALANSTELESLHKLRSIDYRLAYNLENLDDKLETVKLVKRAAKLQQNQHLLDGVMKWELMTSYKIRLWQIKKSLAELEAENAASDQFKANIQEIINSLPQSYVDHKRRLLTAGKRMQVATVEVDELLQQYDAYLQAMLRDELLVIKERIEIYRSQALLSVAHIYDLNLAIGEVSQ